MDNMKVYEKCQELAQSIKESKEYIEFEEIKNIIQNELGLKDKVDKFEKIKYEEQLLAMQGEKQDESKMQQLQELYEVLIKEPKVKEYFDKEVKFNLMIADVNKIIGESIKDLL
jgi:cell fate (sporulation/competence/biofilm development) regulator YlbF (YheA/YmcA/DUF963 family)